MGSDSRNHPFLEWCGSLARIGGAKVDGKDVVLSAAGAKRFALGVHEGNPLLCWVEEDRAAMESVKWTSGAVVFGLRGEDWVALSAADVRVPGSAAIAPVPLRLFIPVASGRMAAWKAVAPQKVAIGCMETEKGVPVFTGTPFRELPVKLLG